MLLNQHRHSDVPSAGAGRARLALLTLALLALFAVLASLPAIPQPESYHAFADRRACLGVPNCQDVLSNAALLLAGLAGTFWLGRKRPGVAGVEAAGYRLFFFAIALTGIGSAYYHWAPDHHTLFWDRLPMGLAFMALLAAVVAERLGARAGRLALVLLPLLGMASVLAWYLSELGGAGDLRPYLAMQAGGALAIVLLVALFPPRHDRGRDIPLALGIYGLALLCDKLLDQPLFDLGGVVSGHTLKHLLAAGAVLVLLRMLRRRVPLPDPASAAP